MNECTVHTSCKTSTSVVLKQSVITCLATTCQLLKQQKSWNVWRDWSSETLWILSNLLWTHISSYTKLMISFASPSMLFSTTQTARNKRVSVFCVDYSSAFNTVIQSRISYKKSYLCLWIQDFKSGKMGLHCSSSLSVSTGVPQDCLVCTQSATYIFHLLFYCKTFSDKCNIL